MNGCEPSYCARHGSKNWASCNMAAWNPKYKRFCKSQSHCKLSHRNKIDKDQVPVNTLHEKMPYIWRFLDRKTRKKIVMLAKKPVEEINIDHMKYP